MSEIHSKLKKMKNGLKLRSTPISPESKDKIVMHEVLDQDSVFAEGRNSSKPAVVGTYITKGNEVVESQGNVEAQQHGVHADAIDKLGGGEPQHTLVNNQVSDMNDNAQSNENNEIESVDLLGKSEDLNKVDGDGNKANLKLIISKKMTQLRNSINKKIDTRSKEEKIQDALATHGAGYANENAQDDHTGRLDRIKTSLNNINKLTQQLRFANAKNKGVESRDQSNTIPPPPPKEFVPSLDEPTNAKEAWQKRMYHGDIALKEIERKELADKVYKLAHGEHTHNLIKNAEWQMDKFHRIPGTDRIAIYGGANEQGQHIFRVSGRGMEENIFLVRRPADKKKLEIVRIPGHIDSGYLRSHLSTGEWGVRDEKDARNHANWVEKNSSPYAHLALRALKRSKPFTDIFPDVGKFVDYGDRPHPDDFKVDWDRSYREGTPENPIFRSSVAVKSKGRWAHDYIFNHRYHPEAKEHQWYLSTVIGNASRDDAEHVLENIIKKDKGFKSLQEKQPGEHKLIGFSELRKPIFTVHKSLKTFFEKLHKSIKEKIKGGLADKEPDSDFNKKQLKAGVKTEKEHTDSKAEAKEIAKDHLQEQKNKGEPQTYYTDLPKMEAGACRKSNNSDTPDPNKVTYFKTKESNSKNDHGNVVGTKGKTGVHSHGFIYRGSSAIPRKNGGVMVLVAGNLLGPNDSDELRFTNDNSAINYLKSLTINPNYKEPWDLDKATQTTHHRPVGEKSLDYKQMTKQWVDKMRAKPSTTIDYSSGSPVVKPASPVKTPEAPKPPKSLEKSDINTIVNDIMNLHKKNGGSTYNLKSGAMCNADAYAVSPYIKNSEIIKGELKPEHLHSFINKNKGLLSEPNNHVGTWYDPEEKVTFLDVTKTIPDKNEAIEVAKAANQKSIFHLRSKSIIPTGGSGRAE